MFREVFCREDVSVGDDLLPARREVLVWCSVSGRKGRREELAYPLLCTVYVKRCGSVMPAASSASQPTAFWSSDCGAILGTVRRIQYRYLMQRTITHATKGIEEVNYIVMFAEVPLPAKSNSGSYENVWSIWSIVRWGVESLAQANRARRANHRPNMMRC